MFVEKGVIHGIQLHYQFPQSGTSCLSDKPVALHCPRVVATFLVSSQCNVTVTVQHGYHIWCGHQEFRKLRASSSEQCPGYLASCGLDPGEGPPSSLTWGSS